ncbi:MAG: efflux RND transporter periplasmic adaptor subunit [Verrucomicrobia bacterium]|nr:efflux RND transporter periplasmic adaptor subunit [Verrucomicrobiota bacterium]
MRVLTHQRRKAREVIHYLAMKPKSLFILLVIALASAVGFFVGGKFSSTQQPSTTASARKVKFYQSPMHPWIKSEQAGKCTICGMDLVPIYEGDAGFEAKGGLVTLTPATSSVIGVQTSEVRRGPLFKTLRVTGVVDDDETLHRIVSAHVAGRIEKLFVNQVGTQVAAGAPLATLYSPEIQTAQRVYIERMRAGPSGYTASERAESRERLLAMGLLPEEITQLEETGQPTATITVHASYGGTIITRAAYEGQYVETHDKLFELGDFSHLWFIFYAYEADLAWLHVGQSVEVSSPSIPGSGLIAPITFIDPNLNESTRTARVRVVLDNPDRKLLHRATATGRVQIATDEVLLVPRSAILHTQAKPQVYVDKNGGTYEPRTLELGRVGDDFYEVRSGLREGEYVVTQGALLLDGQAQLAHSASGDIPTPSPESHDADIETLKPLVLATADAADALASDDLARYQKQLPALQNAFAAYVAAFPDAAKGPLAQFAEGLKSGPDIKTARSTYEEFSTAIADLAKAAHLHHSGAIKIYQCPMTPVLGTGRWLQRSEPLHNPFFGSAMPDCGEEIK